MREAAERKKRFNSNNQFNAKSYESNDRFV